MNSADSKPDALFTIPVLRGRFAELLAPASGLGCKSSKLFLVGLFSMLDALLDRHMEDALAYLPLSSDIADALLGKPGPFHTMLQLVKFYEKADWDNVAQCATELNLDESVMPEAYIEAAKWAGDFAVAT